MTVHLVSHNFPLLIRLFVNDGMMCSSAVPMGRLGKSSLADAADCSNSPDAVPTILAGASASIFLTGAEGMKKCLRAPVSAMAVSCRSVVIYELGGLQVVTVDSKDKLVISATACTGPISHLVSPPLFL